MTSPDVTALLLQSTTLPLTFALMRPDILSVPNEVSRFVVVKLLENTGVPQFSDPYTVMRFSLFSKAKAITFPCESLVAVYLFVGSDFGDIEKKRLGNGFPALSISLPVTFTVSFLPHTLMAPISLLPGFRFKIMLSLVCCVEVSSAIKKPGLV